MERLTLTPEDEIRLVNLKRSARLVVSHLYFQLAKQYQVASPHTGVFSARTGTNEEIIVNWDLFKSDLGQDYTDCLELEIGREAYERVLSLGNGTLAPDETTRRQAIKYTLIGADNLDILLRYLGFKEQTFKMVGVADGSGDNSELAIYYQLAAEIQNS